MALTAALGLHMVAEMLAGYSHPNASENASESASAWEGPAPCTGCLDIGTGAVYVLAGLEESNTGTDA